MEAEMTKEKVLWIEDGAMNDLPFWASAVIMDGSYDLVIATDVTMGADFLVKDEFYIVIFDIRLPPGKGTEWIRKYKRAGSNKASARLGLELLRCLFLNDQCPIGFQKEKTKWLTQVRVGVLTIESWVDLKDDFKSIKIDQKAYQQKTAGAPITILLDLINRIQERIRESNKRKTDDDVTDPVLGKSEDE